jgi:hypothetical protein
MISFALSLLLIPYGIAVAVTLVFAVVNVFHLVHYGATTKTAFVVTFAYLAGLVFLFYFTWTALQGTNWQMPLVFGLPSFGPQQF